MPDGPSQQHQQEQWTPVMEPEGLAMFREHLAQARAYLEYGSGGSTVMAATTGVPDIFSVDTDAQWIRKVAAAVSTTALRAQLIHCDLGPVKEWGYPVSAQHIQRFQTYATLPWDAARAAGKAPDLVLIDGRFRVACFLFSLASAAPGTTILFDDYIGRDPYRVIEEFCKPVQFAGRMARFVVQPPADTATLMQRFAQYALQPD